MTRSNKKALPLPKKLAASQLRAICIIGFTSHMILQPFLFWQFSLLTLVGTNDISLHSFTTIANNIVFPLAIILLGVAYRFSGHKKIFSTKNSVWFMIACFVVGIALAVSTSLFSFAIESVLVSLFGICIGIGCAMGIFLWQQALYRQSSRDAMAIQVSGSIIAGVLYFAVRWLPDIVVLMSSIVFFLPLSAGILLYLIPENDEQPSREFLQQSWQRFAPFFKENWTAILIIASMGFVWGLFYALALVVSDNTFLGNLFSFGRIISGLLAALYIARFRSYPSMDILSKIALPICVTVVLLMPLIEHYYFFVLAEMFYVVFGLSSIVLMLSCNDAARTRAIHPAIIYCGVLGPFYLVQMLGYLAGPIICPDMASLLGTTQRLVVALLIVYGLSVLGFIHAFRKKKSKNTSPAQDLDSSLVERFSLTERELDIVRLLLKGRSVSFISEDLSISENTVRFHMKNIYLKAGVHSKQELIDLFELG